MGEFEGKEDLLGSRRWFGIAVGALVLSGLFSLVLVVGRLPGLSGLIEDPLFARRCLVVHVNLALVVWMYACLAALYLAMSSEGPRFGGWPSGLAVVGILMIVGSGGVWGVRPVLSNYIPALEHPLFLVGLCCFGVAVAWEFLGRLWGSGGGLLPEESKWGLRAASVAFFSALLTFLGSWWTTPTGLDSRSYYELLFWGGGHVLQVASVAGMLSVWLWLMHELLGRSAVGERAAKWLFGALVLPSCMGPFWAFAGTTTSPYYPRFTALMRWSIFPVTLAVLAACVWALWKARGELSRAQRRTPFFFGFVASAGLTLLGFVLGSMIRGSTTLIPAHYHASIGGVTVSYMTAGYLFLRAFGWELGGSLRERLAVWQPALFGIGQSVFAVGFGYAGLGRKTYGHEQHVRTLSEYIGLAGMGLGGLIAMISGLCFLSLIGIAWVRSLRAARDPQARGRHEQAEIKIQAELQAELEGRQGAPLPGRTGSY